MTQRFRARLRRAVFVVHLWIGLSVGLLFAVVSATGSAIVYRRELDGMARPYLRYVQAPVGAQALPLDEVRRQVRRDHPEAKPTDVAIFLYQPWDGGALTTFIGPKSYAIDPYTGRTIALLSEKKSLPLWLKEFHTDLLAGEKGEGLNGWGGVAACVLLLSGLWLWWPATRKQIRLRLTVRRGVSLRRTTYDLHNVFGFYSLALLFIVTVTGVGLCFNKPVRDFVFAKTGHKRPPPPAPIVPQGTPLPADDLLAIARREVPDARFVLATFPARPNLPFSTMLQRTGAGFFPYVTLKIDPYSGAVVAREDDADATFGAKIMRQIAVLHFGFWGGTASKVLYIVLGLVPLALYVTGIMLWWNRLRAKRKAAKRPKTARP
ncbi:MAG: PepSY-associated TM helix domain-containing protein [Fimbriimonas sp.]